jgi:hypothetical protein
MRLGYSLGLGLLACSTVAAAQTQLRGRVIDILTGRGIPDVKIHAAGPVYRPDLAMETTSGANGEFSFPGGTPSFQKPGYRQITTGVYNDKDACCQWGWDLQGRNIESPFYYYSMMPQGELSGVVLKSGGQIAAGYSITFQRVGAETSDTRAASFEMPVVITTDRNGRFHLQLDAVNTDIFVSDEACGALRIGRVRLMPGEQSTAQFTIPKQRLHTVRGEISNHVPPIAGGELHVRLTPISRYDSGCVGPPETVLPQSGGAFLMKGIPPGKYMLEVGLQPRCIDDVCSRPSWNAYHVIEVIDRDIDRVSVSLFPNVRLKVTMHWEEHAPDPYDVPELDLVDETGVWYHPHGFAVGKTEESFVFSQVQPGQYALRPRPRATNFYLREVRLDGNVIPADSISVSNGQEKANLDLYFSAKVSHLQALGVDQNHSHLKRHVALLFQRPEGPYWILSPQGNRVPPGDYFVLVLQPELPLFAIRPEILSRYADHAVRVSLKPGQDLKLEVVALEAYPLAR